MRCVILDDYQKVALSMADWQRLPASIEVVPVHEHVTGHSALIEVLAEADIVVLMRERTPFPAELIRALPRLSLLVTSGMRNAAIDMAAARACNVTVCGAGSDSAPPAELAFALILGLARKLVVENRHLREGGPWQSTLGTTLAGRTLGLLGLGKIGARMATIGAAFGMRVIAYSQNLTRARCEALGVLHAGSLEALLEQSDVLSIHLVTGERNRGLIGRAELLKMKPSAFLINTSRAVIVDEAALIEALTAKRLAGAGLDVFSQEPLPLDHPLRTLPEVLVTPHLGYVTDTNYRRWFEEAVEDIEAWLEGAPVRRLDS